MTKKLETDKLWHNTMASTHLGPTQFFVSIVNSIACPQLSNRQFSPIKKKKNMNTKKTPFKKIINPEKINIKIKK